MRIFDRVPVWPNKVNFMDENNIALGYDMEQNCCEYADWFIADVPTLKIPEPRVEIKRDPEGIHMPDWHFDKTFFREVGYDELQEANKDAHYDDRSSIVIFRITNGEREKFIHLFNCQNGYYSHGFEFKAGNESIKEGEV